MSHLAKLLILSVHRLPYLLARPVPPVVRGPRLYPSYSCPIVIPAKAGIQF